jgi:hypothetical protein
MKRTAPAVLAKTTFAIVAVAGFVVLILSAFAKSAAVVVRPPFSLELTAGAIRFVVSAEVFASEALFALIIVPLVILVSVSGHCFPPYQEHHLLGARGKRGVE